MKATATLGKTDYKTYCDVSEEVQISLYEDVEGEFAPYYRFINHDDEREFKAKLEADQGKARLLVDFDKSHALIEEVSRLDFSTAGVGILTERV